MNVIENAYSKVFHHHGLGEIVFDLGYGSWKTEIDSKDGPIEVTLPEGCDQDPSLLERCYSNLQSLTALLDEIKSQAVSGMFSDVRLEHSVYEELISSLKLHYAGFWSNGDLQILFNGGEAFGGQVVVVGIDANGNVTEASIQ